MPVLKGDQVASVLKKGASTRVDAAIPPQFAVGDAVMTRNLHPIGHTRIPRYARGRRGIIDRDHGAFIFPDTNALGQGKKPQHVYSVCFTAQELWGDTAPSKGNKPHKIYIDLWDDYLKPI